MRMMRCIPGNAEVNGYRLTYNNTGIYEALKEEMYSQTGSSDAWMKFKDSPECNWLPQPLSYGDNNESYFTKAGYDKFMELTMPIVKEYIPEEYIVTIETNIPRELIVYEDEYQFVINIPVQESLIPLKREGKEWEHSNGEYTFENENIHMRPATEDDIENMYQWEMESIDKSLIDNEKVQSLIRQDCHDSLKDTLMIMDGDNTIGMFTACMIDDGEWRYIGEIYLIPEYRGQGIGSTILRNEMANYDKIRLQVAMDNEGAFKLYTSLGFKIAKEDDTNKMYIMEYVKPENIQEAVTIDGYRLIELAYMDKFPNMSPEQEAVLKDYSNARDQLVAAASYYKREKNARKKALKRIQLQHNTSDSDYFRNQCNQKMAVIRQEIEILDREYAEAYQRNVATMNQLADEFDRLEAQKQKNGSSTPQPSNSGYPDSIVIPLPRMQKPSELLGKFLHAQEDTEL